MKKRVSTIISLLLALLMLAGCGADAASTVIVYERQPKEREMLRFEDIEYIRQNYGFDRLSDNLREIAQVRLDYPDAPLKELGTYLDTPVGKSGVNHRLRKLSELAEKLRG